MASVACMHAWLQLRVEAVRLLELRKALQSRPMATPTLPPSSSSFVTTTFPLPASNVAASYTPTFAQPAFHSPAALPSSASHSHHHHRHSTIISMVVTTPVTATRSAHPPLVPRSLPPISISQDRGDNRDRDLVVPQSPATSDSKRGGPKRKAPAPARFEDSPPRRQENMKRPRVMRKAD
mmetsp:Transcript_12207/g.16652  ORF Transcript_12207/g.16652 Transcript_12207/m.16652 type:complete len:180 (+) Transcript_12207:73-612(+)